MTLALCASCARHVRNVDETCPFCGGSAFERLATASRVARSAVVVGVVLAAASTAMIACSAEALYGCAPPCGEPADSGSDQSHADANFDG
jgi:hypothetical protein